MSEFEYVTWEEVQRFVEKLSQELQGADISGVYGLPRGGLVFAVMLSHALDVPFLAAPHPNCVIVDDICDSGESLVHYVRNTSGEGISGMYFIATMYYKEGAAVTPDYFYKLKHDAWIQFPWEI